MKRKKLLEKKINNEKRNFSLFIVEQTNKQLVNWF